ncbi:hypothetical protein CDAR_459251 [Caerostris darwini]|uniref:Uncharacterized protein n=1 Tax=Caerostris darwini TaxID=1538125 RepID=A0AAV4PIL0_9ARAC|nr:hypothetical protein CDAR_459251 [Caerostris darwini]
MRLFVFVEEADFAATNSVLSELQGWRDVLEWMEQAGSRDCWKECVWIGDAEIHSSLSHHTVISPIHTNSFLQSLDPACSICSHTSRQFWSSDKTEFVAAESASSTKSWKILISETPGTSVGALAADQPPKKEI